MAYKTNPRLGYPIYFNPEPELLKLARENRNNPTPAEKNLWARLRQNRIAGMKFRRQHPVSRFIADFYCHQAKLIVELDGGYHDNQEQQESDSGRQKELEDLGLMVIRFKNEEVEKDIEGVINQIMNILLEKL